MKAFIAFAVLFTSALALTQTPSKEGCTAGDGRYCVYRNAETRTCKVWTADTLDGPQLLGPFDKREEAIDGMCNVYSPGSEEPSKCAHVEPSNACSTQSRRNLPVEATAVKTPFKAVLAGQDGYLRPEDRDKSVPQETAQWAGFPYSRDPGSLMPEVGFAYNSLTSEVKLPCIVEGDKDLQPPTSLGQDGHMNVYYVTDSESFSSTMNFNASASFGYGVFSGDASVSYFRSNRLTTYASYLLINSVQRNQQQVLPDYHLTRKAADVLKKQGRLAFIQLCGDEYFEGKVMGGDILAILKASSSDDSEQSSVSGSLKASAWGDDVSATVSQQLQSMKSQGKLEVEITRRGPAEDWPHGTVDELLQYGRTFPSKVKAGAIGAWPVEYLALRYRELDEYPTTPEQARFFDTEAEYLRKLYTRRSAVTYAVGHRAEFAGFDPNKASQELDGLFDEISKVQQAGLTCSADSKKCSLLRHREVPLSPDRPGWLAIDPKRYTPTPVGGVFGQDQKLLEVQGFWYAHCDANGNFLLIPPDQDNQITFTNRKTGTTTSAGKYQRPLLLPAESDASFMVVDGPPSKIPGVYQDNCVGSPPISVRVSRPLYPEDFNP